jgi:hypothetical protein
MYNSLRIKSNENNRSKRGFYFGGSADIFEEAEVVMIGDCHRIECLKTARSNKLLSVFHPLILRNRPVAGPVKVSRRMHLKIAFVKMSAFVHTTFPSSLYLFSDRAASASAVSNVTNGR